MTRLQSAVRVSFYYAMLFMAVGFHLPFWPVWLQDRGLDSQQIGLALSTPYFGRALFSPMAGWVADHLGERKRPLVVIALLATVLWTSFALAHSFPVIVIIGFFAAGLWSSLMPIGDIIALDASSRWAFHYSHARLWGSISFIAASLGTGALMGFVQPSVLVWLISGGLGLTAVSAMLLPDLRPQIHHLQKGDFGALIRMPAFRWFLAATSLNQAGHTVLYGFATLHWQRAGLSSEVIGMLWSEASLAEIALFTFAARATQRIKPGALLLIAMICGIVRWVGLSLTTDLPWLAIFQLLHAATFGCAHLGAMYFLQQSIPAALTARAQGLYSAMAAGVAPGLMAPIAGWVYSRYDGMAFLVMAVPAALAAYSAVRMVKAETAVQP